MGTKSELAGPIISTIEGLEPGPCLDLFAGMCSVASSLADTARPAWCNDYQRYAEVVARALLTSQDDVPDYEQALRVLKPHYERNWTALSERFGRQIESEAIVLDSGDHEGYSEQYERWPHPGRDQSRAAEIKACSQAATDFPYRLASLSYAYGYFGLEQAASIDSIRYAIDWASASGELDGETERWALVSLLQVASRVAAAPGHFAQYLKVKDSKTLARVRSQRRRDVWSTFQQEFSTAKAAGVSEWRGRNKVFRGKAMDVLAMIRASSEKPTIVFADPPYTQDHYSRYYHVLETLVAYDYPMATGVGRYRPDRFSSPFSLASRVHTSFQGLIAAVADLGAALVMTYPSNGLLYEKGHDLPDLLGDSYRDVSRTVIDYAHSTMGGSKGDAESSVEEQVFVGVGPRR